MRLVFFLGGFVALIFGWSWLYGLHPNPLELGAEPMLMWGLGSVTLFLVVLLPWLRWLLLPGFVVAGYAVFYNVGHWIEFWAVAELGVWSWVLGQALVYLRNSEPRQRC